MSIIGRTTIFGLLMLSSSLGMSCASLTHERATRHAAQPPGKFQWCVGAVCVGIPEKEILSSLGAGYADPPASPIQHCYKAPVGSTYLTVIIDDEDPRRSVTGVLATSIPVCADAMPAPLPSVLMTCRGVTLGDSVESAVAVGAKQRSMTNKGYPWYGTDVNVTQLDYQCEPDRDCSMMASVFVTDGRIIGVASWAPDC